jgi:hypothetical protein
METPERSWRWAPEIFAARYGQDLVLLDILKNDYLVLAGAGDHVDECAIGGILHIDEDSLAAQLSEAGLIVWGRSAQNPPRRTAPEAQDDVFSLAPQRPDARDVLAFAWTLIEMIPLYWLRSFPRLVRVRKGAAEADNSPTLSQSLIRSALVFERLLVWAPFQGQCVFRAAMLRRFLARRGLDADWVFGVRTWPFAAHCWLQVGDIVINDRIDHVAGYVPVMVI